MEVVQVEEEVAEVPAEVRHHLPVAQAGRQLHEVDPHPLVEILVLDGQDLHGLLAHLDDLALRVGLVDTEVLLEDKY